MGEIEIEAQLATPPIHALTKTQTQTQQTQLERDGEDDGYGEAEGCGVNSQLCSLKSSSPNLK